MAEDEILTSGQEFLIGQHNDFHENAFSFLGSGVRHPLPGLLPQGPDCWNGHVRLSLVVRENTPVSGSIAAKPGNPVAETAEF